MRATALLHVALVWTSTAHAQEGSLEVGGVLGGHFFDGEQELGAYDFDEADAPETAFLLGARIAYAATSKLSIEGEVASIFSSSTETGDGYLVFAWRAHALLHFQDASPRKWAVRPFVLAGGGGLSAGASDGGTLQADTDLLLHGGGGAKVVITPRFGLRFDARLLLPPTSEDDGLTTDWEVLAGVYLTFGGEHEVPPTFVTGDDDPDRDGLRAGADGCPDQPEDPDQHRDDDGCPDLDDDADGVADADDRCPAEEERRNGYEDADGCADELPAAVAKLIGAIQGVTFVRGSAKLAASSHGVLDEVARVLAANAGVNLEIHGHTDDAGGRDANLKLSQERAEAVKAYLVGIGPDKPVDPATTKAARAKNRRVELVLQP